MSVSVDGCDSEAVSVSSGVPQGSVLGPLLFLVYVNSIADHLSCSYYAFADDFKLYACSEKSKFVTANTPLQKDLKYFVGESLSWNLRLNPEKCLVMTYEVWFWPI